VILSLDPTWTHPESGKRPTLQGLGYQLERAEARARRGLDGDLRGRTPRYADGYCDNEDPWYDGRDHEHTIVDSPRSGTRLSYAQVRAVATSRFWEVPLEDVSATVVYANQTPAEDATFTPLPPPKGISPTLLPFFHGCLEASMDPDQRLGLLPRGLCLRSARLRRFPSATCRDMLVLRVGTAETPGGPRPTLEGLVSWCESLRAAPAFTGPDYVFIRFRLGTNFAPPSYAERLVHKLGQGDLTALPWSGDAQDVVLFNSRAVIIRKASDHVEGTAGSLLDRELMLYAAFLNETACRFSQRITEALVGGPESSTPHQVTFGAEVLSRASGLREDFLAFQTRYYQFDTTGRPYSRRLFERLLESLSFSEHYAEVQSELDRLHQIEQREAENRQASSDRWFEGLLFFIGLAGVVQTVIGLKTMEDGHFTSWVLWVWILGLSGLLAILYLWVRRNRS
jgi:hypothetical protein